jgi:hypothetical protein
MQEEAGLNNSLEGLSAQDWSLTSDWMLDCRDKRNEVHYLTFNATNIK